MIKQLGKYLLEPLTIIMNKSLNDGALPQDWKKANVSPIYKKGPKHISFNYRPISLTSIVCKMMDSIVRNSIMNQLIEENVLPPKQYGFINKRSTTTQQLNYLDKCAEYISLSKVVDVIYFDFAKAFDTVPHHRLMKKLSYQTLASVISGILQGSVLGPILFVIYSNDLPDVVSSSEVYLFVDDTKLVKMIDSVTDSLTIQDDIAALENWS